MKISELPKISLDDIYWNLVFGKSKRRATILELRKSNFRDLPPPVFFLSPGRSGTKWFANLMAHNKSLKAFHEPRPNLGLQGKLAYENYKTYEFTLRDELSKLVKELFITGREQILRYSFKTGKRYVETNNQITFFAPALAELFPNALFVHLNRHPGDFVRSAVRRSFYKNNVEDLKRIAPIKGSPEFEKWDGFSEIAKNAWLWKETNEFIESFKRPLPDNRIMYYDFTNNTPEQLNQLLEFLKIKISFSKIEGLIGQRKNIQRKGSFENYPDWPEEKKSELEGICGKLAKKYGYKL